MKLRHLALALPFVMACKEGGGATAPRTAAPPPVQQQGLVPPGFNPFQGALSAAARWLPADAACPPPWMPPEAARLVDCAAMKQATGALQFVPRNIVAAALPPHVDLRRQGLVGPIKNQEQVGACAGFAVSSVIDNAARRSGSQEVAAALHIFATYSEKQDLGAVTGHAMTTEQVWPYDPRRACRFAYGYTAEGCSSAYGVAAASWRESPVLVSERARADASGRFPVAALEQLPSPVDTTQIAALLAEGEAFYVALSFDRAAWESLSQGGGSILPRQPNPDQAHAVTMVGYRPGRYEREFIIQNSWGTSWGEGGYAYVPESTLREIWSNGYRVRTGAGGVTPPVIGTQGTCADGLPAVFGVCASDLGRAAAPFLQLPGVPQQQGAPASLPDLLRQAPPMPGATACAPGQIGLPFGGGCVAFQ